MNADLQRFVRESLGQKLPRDAIRAELIKAGWRADEVEAALRAYAEVDFPVPVPRRRAYLNAREAFRYLVLFATLYTSALNVGQVLFALIERWLPDPLRRAYDWHQFGEWVRGGTAAIIIAFPIYLVLSRLIGREMAREPEKRGSAIRKWLTYITLFVAAVVIIGDLTVLVTRVLAGELPPRFVLKVLVVFLIAGTVFGHYLGDLRRDEQEGAAPARGTGPGARLAAVAVFAVMLGGLFFSGSPRHERQRQLDEQRVEALRMISTVLESYRAKRGVLPDSLGELLLMPDTYRGATLRDPETGRPYEYRIVDSLHYQLCAEFQTADTTGDGVTGMRSEFWKHPAGRACFPFDVVPPRR